MDKLSKPINVAIENGVLSFDEPRDSYYYEVYIDGDRIATLDSERRPNFIGTNPDVNKLYHNELTVFVLTDVPVEALDIRYSLDGSSWEPYYPNKGVYLKGNDNGDIQDIWFEANYLATGVKAQPSTYHVGFQVINDYKITYDRAGSFIYKEEPSVTWKGNTVSVYVEAARDETITPPKISGLDGAQLTNCDYDIIISEDHTVMRIDIYNPKGNIKVTPMDRTLGYYDVKLILENCSVYSEPIYFLEYQQLELSIIPNNGYRLPLTKNEDDYSYVRVSDGDEDIDFEYNATTGVITVIPTTDQLVILAECKKVGA